MRLAISAQRWPYCSCKRLSYARETRRVSIPTRKRTRKRHRTRAHRRKYEHAHHIDITRTRRRARIRTLASSSALHRSRRIFGLTLCLHRCAHCCPERVPITLAMSLHRLPCVRLRRRSFSSSSAVHGAVSRELSRGMIRSIACAAKRRFVFPRRRRRRSSSAAASLAFAAGAARVVVCAVVVLRRSVGERGAGARAGVCGVCTTLTEENAALTFYFRLHRRAGADAVVVQMVDSLCKGIDD